jgi:PadR family transcriptional regulator, regulatory protein AphA
VSLEYAILGLLSWRSLSGYDLKKVFEESVALYWSGNNNEIYRTLVNLYKEELVTREIQLQENYPARKVYSITDKGLAELNKWVHSAVDLPQRKHSLLIQLAWADMLSPDELDDLLEKYEDEVMMQLLICRAQGKPKGSSSSRLLRETYLDISQARTPREALLWRMITENWITFYENELSWVSKLRTALREE